MPAFALDDNSPCLDDCGKLIYLMCFVCKRYHDMKKTKCPKCGGDMKIEESGKSGYVKVCKKCGHRVEVNR
jgi:tRNA(Ile2) C34 agmatinyltransferase TiaS